MTATTLKTIIKNSPYLSFSQQVPGIKPAIDIVLGETCAAVDENATSALFLHDYGPGGFQPDISRQLLNGDSQSWVEFISDVTFTPLSGHLEGTHILYGSAIEKLTIRNDTVFDMYTIYASVNGDYRTGEFIARDVLSWSISPITVRAGRIPGLNTIQFGYKLCMPYNGKYHPSSIMRRDLIFHRMAMQYIHGQNLDQRPVVQNAIDQLPAWLRATKAGMLLR